MFDKNRRSFPAGVYLGSAYYRRNIAVFKKNFEIHVWKNGRPYFVGNDLVASRVIPHDKIT